MGRAAGRWLAVVSVLTIAACGDAVPSGTTGPGRESPSPPGTRDDELPPPGASADGWKRSELGLAEAIDCEMSPEALASSSAARVSVSNDTLYAGYKQIGDNQDPRVVRVSDDEIVYCVAHETSGPDGRAVAVTWDGGEFAYVVYTIVGGGSEFDGSNGWLSSFAPGAITGGNKKVSYIARMRVADGSIHGEGTFVISVLNPDPDKDRTSPRVNSHAPAEPVVVLEKGNVEFRGNASHKPIDSTKQLSMLGCPDSATGFDSLYVFSADLTTLICAEAVPNEQSPDGRACQSSRPCSP